jgi:hypothetical protein
MKEVFMGILGVFLLLFFIAVFGGFGAGAFLWFIKPQMEAGRILKNGVETTATVIGIDSKGTVSSKSGNTTKTEQYYALILSFTNSEGNSVEYKTRGIYPKIFINRNNVKQGKTIQVMYVNNKAVVKGFVPKYETWLWFFPVVFGAIAAGLLIFLIVGLIQSANDYIIKKYGVSATGTYLEHKKLNEDDKANLNSIIFTFTNDNGDTVEVKSRYMYANSGAEELAKMGAFPIMYKGKKAVIMINKNNDEKRKEKR